MGAVGECVRSRATGLTFTIVLVDYSHLARLVRLRGRTDEPLVARTFDIRQVGRPPDVGLTGPLGRREECRGGDTLSRRGCSGATSIRFIQ